jgi:F0F1-type ATP synthase membrane subunit b/b'
VNGVETAVDNDQAGVSAQIDEATEALEEARAARAPFEAACKPAG